MKPDVNRSQNAEGPLAISLMALYRHLISLRYEMRNHWIISLTLAIATSLAHSAEPSRPAVNFTNFTPNLPILHLEAKEQIVSERKVPCVVRVTQPPELAPSNAPALTGVVRIHGASSQMYPKKSFALTMDKPVRWLGMRESTHWVLNAAFIDRSLMRHKLSYDLFRALSSGDAKRYAPASRFVEVTLNGRYRGAFLLIERVDRALLELQPFNSNAPSHACIYKAEDHGGDFGRPGHAAFEQREPDPLKFSYWEPLDRFSRFVSRSKDAEFFDRHAGIGAQLDLDNTIDFHLLVLLTSNMDGNDKNLIIARNAQVLGAPAAKFFFVPWDYDATFGRNWNAWPVEPTAWLPNFLWERLLRDETYQKKFAVRWSALRQTTFSEKSILAMIDENVRTLGDAVKRNEARWQSATGVYPDRLSFGEDIAEMRQWVPARLKWLDAEIRQRTSRQP
jgi:spore coat protein CotH